MQPQLAALLTVVLIIYLFWMDRNNNKGFSKALWVPFVWMYFTRSRNISEWLDLQTPDPSLSMTSIIEGNPLNRNIYTALLILGIFALIKRKIDWRTIFVKNSWIWLYFIFGAISIFWSDYPYVSFKRLIKASCVVIMALVILTEARPYLAIGLILKRLAFILLPLSVLFIKYYPEFGRAYHHSTGELMSTGVTSHKNALGALCLVSGIYFLWNLFWGGKKEGDAGPRLHFSIYMIMFVMLFWLFRMANSATSLACMVVTILLFTIAKHPAFVRNPSKLIVFGIVCVVIAGLSEMTFGIKEYVIELLGRKPDLTTRVPMWEHVLNLTVDPIFGAGYESFWLGERLAIIQARWGDIVQAHNGYLEMYLNMGLVGVFFIICWIFSGLLSVNRHLSIDYPSANLRLCLIVVVALYNYTEATFYGPNVMWLLFFIGIITLPNYKPKINQNV
ncbi:MAG: O-antigen ligase family protein [Syntrophaceae bacterium]|nr:O-antigen ligase family protein [Syntrophaceae bacterium]